MVNQKKLVGQKWAVRWDWLALLSRWWLFELFLSIINNVTLFFYASAIVSSRIPVRVLLLFHDLSFLLWMATKNLLKSHMIFLLYYRLVQRHGTYCHLCNWMPNWSGSPWIKTSQSTGNYFCKPSNHWHLDLPATVLHFITAVRSFIFFAQNLSFYK